MLSEEDSEYLPDADSVSSVSNDNESIESNETEYNNIDTLSEDEIAELTVIVYEELEDYIKNNILLMSSPKFYKGMTEYVTEVIFDIFSYANVYI